MKADIKLCASSFSVTP